MSSDTLSWSSVKPVTYAQPAPAPSMATSRNAGPNDDIDATAMIDMPVVTTAVVNTPCRGSLRWAQSNVTTPRAAPTPSAVINRPNADGPPRSTSVATVGPRGTMAPPPMSP